MRFETHTLVVPTSVAAGTAKDVSQYHSKTIQIIGTGTWTLAIQGSIDGTNFIDLESGIAAAAIKLIPATVKMIRINVTAYTTGTPTAVFAGFNSQVN